MQEEKRRERKRQKKKTNGSDVKHEKEESRRIKKEEKEEKEEKGIDIKCLQKIKMTLKSRNLERKRLVLLEDNDDDNE